MHISIVGITGYTGLELLRLALNHPHVTVSSIHATKKWECKFLIYSLI